MLVTKQTTSSKCYSCNLHHQVTTNHTVMRTLQNYGADVNAVITVSIIYSPAKLQFKHKMLLT